MATRAEQIALLEQGIEVAQRAGFNPAAYEAQLEALRSYPDPQIVEDYNRERAVFNAGPSGDYEAWAACANRLRVMIEDNPQLPPSPDGTFEKVESITELHRINESLKATR